MKDDAAIRAELESILAELMNRAQGIESSLSTPGSADWEENATESEDDEVMSSIGEMTKREIHEVKLALNRLENGLYGKCSVCGKAIGAERLKALPFTTTCVHCS